MPRIGDIYAAMPAMTGKLELEYEGELKGADNVVREIIRAAVARTYDKYFHGNSNMNQVVQWFDLGGEIQLRDSAGAQEMLHKLRGIQGLLDKLSALGLSGKEPSEVLVSGAEFILEGLYAHKTHRPQRGADVYRRREAAAAARSRATAKKTRSANSGGSEGRLIERRRQIRHLSSYSTAPSHLTAIRVVLCQRVAIDVSRSAGC